MMCKIGCFVLSENTVVQDIMMGKNSFNATIPEKMVLPIQPAYEEVCSVNFPASIGSIVLSDLV
jgi:hypothetical protein